MRQFTGRGGKKGNPGGPLHPAQPAGRAGGGGRRPQRPGAGAAAPVFGGGSGQSTAPSPGGRRLCRLSGLRGVPGGLHRGPGRPAGRGGYVHGSGGRPPAGPGHRPAPHLPGHGHSGDAAAAGRSAVADHGGGKPALSAALPAAYGVAGASAGAVPRPGRPLVAGGGPGGRHVPDRGLGGVGDAAPHGDLFPSLHPSGGRRLSAAGGL